MENGTELLPQPQHWRGFNFLFHNNFLILFLKEYEVGQEPPHLYLHRKTKEPFYLLHHGLYVQHDERLLPWPYESHFSDEGSLRVYPVALLSEQQEEDIFRDYVFSLYRNWGQDPWGSQLESYEGTDAVHKFLEYQYSNSPMGIGNFLNKVESIVFDKDYLNSCTIRQTDCNIVAKNWLGEKRQGLKDRLGQYYPLAIAPEPKGNRKDGLTASQHLLIEYFSKERLTEEPSNQQLDKAVRHRELANKHGLSADNFKKAFKRILSIIEVGPTIMQKGPYRNDLIIIKQHFIKNDQRELAQKVDTALNELNLRN